MPAAHAISAFDCTEMPWIPVRLHDGEAAELSLKETFSRAAEIRELSGELPTQSFAIVRLLLAILHRSLPETDRPGALWAELFAHEQWPLDAILGYLEEWQDRFDLLHPERPFLQVAGLHTAKGEMSGLERLIADIPNGEQFFTTRRDAGIDSIDYAEATRWLVHAQAFDPSGIKSGATDDPRVKGGKGYPIGTGWAGELGGLLLEGKNLKETLLLNLVLGVTAEIPFEANDDRPIWEQDEVPSGAALEQANRPVGQAGLFTWPNRRILLGHNGTVVTSVLLTNGFPLRPQNMHHLESMTAWRRSEPQQKALKIDQVYMPRRHSPERSFWRGLASILPEQGAPDGAARRAPGTLLWLASLRTAGYLEPTLSFRTRAVGIEYGPQSATIAEVIDDTLVLSTRLLGADGAELTTMVVDTIAATERAVNALATFAGNLAIAAGGDSDGASNRAREAAYFAIDPEFRRWLVLLGSESSPTELRERWTARARTALHDLGRTWADEAGPRAWVGREAAIGGWVNTSKAHIWFTAALHKALPSGIAVGAGKDS